jgi:hypothetical protein
MKGLFKKFEHFWAEEQSLTILFFILVVQIFIVIPLGQQTVVGRIIFTVFYIFLLSAGMFLLVKNITVRTVLIILVASLTVLSSDIFFASASLGILDNCVAILYCILLSWIVLLRTFSEGRITIHRIMGSIVVYLLISLLFTTIYHTVYLIEGEEAFKGLSSFDKKELMYFSLTSLTTMGYGDILPAAAFTRSMANLEALIGQLYPAILIARLVSMEFESSKETKGK